MKRTACITLDMELDYGDPQKRIHLLENPEYFERYVSIINKYHARVTMFTVTNLFESRGDSFRNLAGRIPLELAVHSHTHDPNNACSLDEVRNAHKAYEQFCACIPSGYRAPIGRIDREGFSHLLDHGFVYDSSIYSSYRPGKYGYNNLHMPNVPFRVVRSDGASLIEFPFTSIERIRIVFALSYAKLIGWGAYSLLLKLFGLPEIALLLSHPYDFYFGTISNNAVGGAEGLALRRNTGREFAIFENLLAFLRCSGYEFVHLSEIYKYINTAKLETYPLEAFGRKTALT